MTSTAPRRSLAGLVLVALAAVLPFLTTVANDYVYDDHVLLFDTQTTLTSALTDDLFGTEADGSAVSGYWRPLVRTSYWLEGRMFGARAAPRHVVNLLIHAACAVLMLRLLRRLPAFAPLALPAALLFATHPIHAESIAIITGRTDPLALAWGLLAAHALLDRRDARALVWFVAAMASKESAAVFVPLLAWLAFATTAPLERRGRAVRVFCGGLAVVVVFFVVKVAWLGIVPPASAWRGEGDVVQRLLTFVAVLPRYVGMMVFPVRSSIVHDTTLVASMVDARLWVGLAVCVGLGVAAGRGGPPLRGGVVALVLTLAPASNLIPITYAFVDQPFPLFERYLYVPSVFGCVVLALAAASLARRCVGEGSARSRFGIGLIAICACAYAARTWVRVGEFSNDVVLYERAAAGLKRPAPLLLAAADAAHRGGDTNAALRLYDAAVAADRDDAVALASRANFMLYLSEYSAGEAQRALSRGETHAAHEWSAARQQWWTKAIDPLDAAIAHGREDAVILEARAFASMIGRDNESALVWYQRAFDAGGRTPTLHQNWRESFAQMRAAVHALAQGPRLSDAITRYSALIRLVCGDDPPTRVPEPIAEAVLTAVCELADLMILRSQGADSRAAEDRYRAVLQLAPKTSRAHEGLGYLAKRTGDRAQALREFEAALAIDPEAYYALSEMFTMAQEDGRTREAKSYFARIKTVLATRGKPAGSGLPMPAIPGVEDGR
ncbi:MAG: tetratricopeptide repeat protein [Planctomycetes bacterium]|nr:tetratricopeptide repeat protein [Planctomycetota bacterium]MCC7169831.1 tetratricopeptide repeat protein [Planctomycetota bacterium]